MLCAPAVPGLSLAEIVVGPNISFDQHAHAEARMILTLSGGFEERCGLRHFTCGVNSVLFRRAGQTHANRFHGMGARYLSVRFDAGWIDQLADIEPHHEFQDSAEFAPLVMRIQREFQTHDAAAPISVQCGILDILSRLMRLRAVQPENRAPHWMPRVKELLRSNASSRLDIFNLAAEAGVHPAHLSRTFRKHVGCTLGGYLRKQRVEFACSEMRDTYRSLADIALSCGFVDQSHFSRVFRRQMGISPKHYRSIVGRHQSRANLQV